LSDGKRRRVFFAFGASGAPTAAGRRASRHFVMQSRTGAALSFCVCVVTAGCQLLATHGPGRSPLKPLSVSPDSIGLEVFSARFAAGNRDVNEELWRDADEQKIPSDLRRALAQHGFRAGVVGPHPPDALARLLKLAEKPVSPERRSERDATELLEEPTVTMQTIYTRAAWRNEIIASKTYDELSLLERDGDQVRGRTYRKADGRFILKAFPESDGRIRLELTPEIQHGDTQQRWTASEGVMRPDASKPKKTFGALELSASMAAGEMLLISCLNDRPGSVGHYFFTEPSDEKLSQKLLVIRVLQDPADSSFAGELVERWRQVISTPE
jgi:hypothetical protein